MSLGAVGGTLLGTLTRGIGNKLPVEQTVRKAGKNSRSSSKAIGKAGMEQAKSRNGLTTDKNYTDRYHGPDDLARDKKGKLTEIETKGNSPMRCAMFRSTLFEPG